MTSEQELALLGEGGGKKSDGGGGGGGGGSSSSCCCGGGSAEDELTINVAGAGSQARSRRVDSDDDEESGGKGKCCGLCGLLRRKLGEPRELTVEQKNKYMRRVYGLLVAQMGVAGGAAVAAHAFPQIRSFFESGVGKVTESAAGVLMVLTQIWSRCRGRSTKNGKRSHVLSQAQLLVLTVAQGAAFSGACALTDNSKPMRIGLLFVAFTGLVLGVNALYGVQTSHSYTAKKAFAMVFVVVTLSALLVALTPIGKLLPFTIMEIVMAAVASFVMGCYTLMAGERMMVHGDIDPDDEDASDGANQVYTEFSSVVGNAVATGGWSLVQEGLCAGYSHWKEKRKEKSGGGETELPLTGGGGDDD